MKVHLVKKETITKYVLEHARSKSSFDAWLRKTKDADWNDPSDIQETFGSADLMGSGTNRVVFDIGGNNYRMICKYLFGENQAHLFICWIGTHAEYNNLCDVNQQYVITIY